MQINREWSMPSGNTFTIPPIKRLVEKCIASLPQNYCIVDPFANKSKYGTITNDLNPEFDTTFHMDALEFLKSLEKEKADMVLYDPPYSITQAAQLYNDFGKDKLEISVANMGYWAAIKDEIARVLKVGGVCISCGWNSNGIGKERYFEMKEILLVPHGGSKNDTIVTVEKKFAEQIDMFDLL